jgi:hypothetical protein
MSRRRFIATRLTPDEAMGLWSRSDEASAFTRPDYLEQLVDEVEWWGVDRAGEIVAAWPLVRAVAGGEIGPPPFCYYVGPMFARSLRDGVIYHRYVAVLTEVFSTLVSAIAEQHRKFSFSLPLGVTDVRVLQWWNFDHPDQAGFHITPRYTARINLAQFPDGSSLLQSFARVRRRDIKHWSEEPPRVVNDVDADRLIELHDQALKRTGGAITHNRHASLRRLIGLAQGGAGSVTGFAPSGGDQIEAAIVLLDGPIESNNVLCLASEVWRDEGLTAVATWHGLLNAMSRDMAWFDFNGANSPHRASDKHYYSAKPELYFDCSFGPLR